jgi:hypothetical protein
MQNEIIYASSAKVLILEKYRELFKANLLGKVIEIKEADKLGGIFPIEIKQILKDRDSTKKKLEEMFQNISPLNPLAGSLEYHLRKAGITFTLGKSQEEKIQYLGLTYENPINLEVNIKRSIIPCQFYNINDRLQEKLIRYSYFFPTSESSPNPSPTSDETFSISDSKIHHPQEFCYY